MNAEHARIIRKAISQAHSDLLMGVNRDYPQVRGSDDELFAHAYSQYRARHDIKPLTNDQLAAHFGWPAEAFEKRPWDD